MTEFPRTEVGGISLPRLIIGTNWFRGFSHTSVAKDTFIKSFQSEKSVAEILCVFLEYGIDAVLGGDMGGPMLGAIRRAEQRMGREIKRIITPHFNITSGGKSELEPEAICERCKQEGGCIMMPHQAVTDALVDRRDKTIRDIDTYTKLIRDYEMVPGLSTHMPETIPYADAQGADVETYIQIYNAAGFLMQVEIDWVMNIIHEAKKPVLTIKPIAAGRLMPIAGLAFVWNTIRAQDMVAVGTTTPDEARECIEISLSQLEARKAHLELQRSRSKASLDVDA